MGFFFQYFFPMLNLLDRLRVFRFVPVSQLGKVERSSTKQFSLDKDPVQSAGTQLHICVGEFCFCLVFSSSMSRWSPSGLDRVSKGCWHTDQGKHASLQMLDSTGRPVLQLLPVPSLRRGKYISPAEPLPSLEWHPVSVRIYFKW